MRLQIFQIIIQPTNYPLSIFCSETNDLHLDVGSTDWGKHLLQLIPHTQHWTTQNMVRPTPKTNLTLQTHRRFLTVPPPVGTETQEHIERLTTTRKMETLTQRLKILFK